MDKLNIQHCFNKVGFKQLHTTPVTTDDLPEPDLEADVTDEMHSSLDVPFAHFINLESDDIIHQKCAPVGPTNLALPDDDDDVCSDYQVDNEPTPTPKFSRDQHVIHFDSLKVKSAEWNDEHIMDIIIELKSHAIEHSMKDFNNRKQSCIKDYFFHMNP